MKSKQTNKNATVLILYHSGSGSTKTIGEILRDTLRKNHQVELISINQPFNYEDLLKFDLIVFGFPTYNFEPSASMMTFIDEMPVLDSVKRAVVFTTCGMYSGNAVRIATTRLKEKKVFSCHNMQIKGPDSYIGLITPPKSPTYEKNVYSKIGKLVHKIKKSLENPVEEVDIPRSKWYVPFNVPVKVYTTRMTGKDIKRMHLIEDRCKGCNMCVNGCQRRCWQETDSLPTFNNSNCEFCLRCVHNCSEQAIVFSDKMKDNPRFDNRFYKKLKKLAEL